MSVFNSQPVALSNHGAASIRAAKVSAFSHATEDKAKVLRAMRVVVDESFSRDYQSRKVKGHYGNEIVILSLVSGSAREASAFLKGLWTRLGDQDRAEILSTVENSIDRSGTLFLRMDKENAFQEQIRIGSVDTIRVEVQFALKRANDSDIIQSVQRKLTTIVAM